MEKAFLFIYCLHLADNALILGHRNSEWCGHGPVLEQDIALTNISLDLLGQARNFYQYAAEVFNSMNEEEKGKVQHLIPLLWQSWNRPLTEDDLAFLREENQYLNVIILELPNGDWGHTILRQFLFSAFQLLQYEKLMERKNNQLAAIAEKSIKEVQYHLRWSSEWVIRLGDGTEESNKRMNRAIIQLKPFTDELFKAATYESEAVQNDFGVDVSLLKSPWLQIAAQVFTQATLPIASHHETIKVVGKEGKHTEHLHSILSEMQYLQKTYPDMSW